MAKSKGQRRFRDRAHWRAWLAEHHAGETEIWVVHYKKHTGKPGLAYEDAVQEALCFGWIDGLLKRIDGEKHMIRYSPRRKNSVWSEPNKARVRKLIARGLMTEAGLAKIAEAKKNGQWQQAALREQGNTIPAELSQALAKNAKARRHFESLAPSYRKHFIGWIGSGKREETRRKRSAEAVELLAQGRRLGMK